MEQGTLMINKAFVTKITTPELPMPSGRGSESPFKEHKSANLITSFAIESTDLALPTITGDYALSRLKEAFAGRGMKDSTADISHISVYESDNKIMKTIQEIDIDHFQAHEYKYADGPHSIELVSNSQLPLESPRTYTWEVFGFDRDVTRTSTWYRSSKHGYDPIRVKSGDVGDVTILPGGYGNVAHSSLTYTQKDSTDGSKIAVELHSKDLHVGVRLTVENDLGQKDTLAIPAFLNTDNS